MKLFGAIEKELRLVWRDRWGMGMMLLMPTLMVIILALAQEDAFKTARATSVNVLWVDGDGQGFSRDLADGLTRSGYFKLAAPPDGSAPARDRALAAVARGDARVCVVLPKGLSPRLRKKVARLAEQAADLSGNGDTKAGTLPGETVEVFFDPTVPESYRRSVANGLGRAAQAVEMKWLFLALSEAVGGPYGAVGSSPERTSLWEPGQLLELREGFAGAFSAEKVPTSVQQNVPGWSLFAMFLIAIPLSCNLIKERDSGTLLRLRMLPVRYETVLLAKVLTYVLFCLFQFCFILLIGLFVLPRLGTPRLDLGGHFVALAAAAVASGFAATSFGVLLGSVARTTDQATIFGTTFAVIGGALGGVMIPSFLMPKSFQLLSPYSPLHWGLDAFLSVFLRNAGFVQILPDLARLAAFAAACVVGAAFWLSRREDSPAGFLFLFRRSP